MLQDKWQSEQSAGNPAVGGCFCFHKIWRMGSVANAAIGTLLFFGIVLKAYDLTDSICFCLSDFPGDVTRTRP